MPSADVDVVVPVHTAERPIGRAVASVLRGTACRVRLLVVCHEIDPTTVTSALARVGFAGDERITLLCHHDGVRSPAGPFNRGLAAVESPFFAELGSDDTLADGALDAWLALARARDAEIVIPSMVWPHAVPTPPVRPRHRTLLDPVADRLAYRTSTVGLISRRLRDRARASEGLRTGEDIAPSLRLWFSGARIAQGDRSAPYVVHTDADDRVTAGNSVADSLAFVPSVVGDRDLRALGAGERAAIAAKLLRVHVFGAITAHSGAWDAEDRFALSAAARDVCMFGDAAGALSIADRRLLALALRPHAPDRDLDHAAATRRRRFHPATVLPDGAAAWRRADGAGRIDAAFALALARTQLARTH